MDSVTEGNFLRAIGENPTEDTPRLILADWLEEQGNPRAEFIRLQCELAGKKLPEKHRDTLRLRERELLNQYRQDWIAALGLPVEDVLYRRGVIDRLRLARWKDAEALEAARSGLFSTLTELDLSKLKLKDRAFSKLLESASFPALRTLILSNNALTDASAIALADSPNFPSLEAVYLFGNSISESGREALQNSIQFQLTQLDLGDHPEGYLLSPGEADLARRDLIRRHLLKLTNKYFQKYDRLDSAMLCVAQYWCDEAADAVHGLLVVSELLEPSLEGVASGYGEGAIDLNIPNTKLPREYGGNSSVVSLWETNVPWDDNDEAIPVWAACAEEGGHQEYEHYSEVYAPAVLLYRHGGYEMLPLRRPQLDGINPGWVE